MRAVLCKAFGPPETLVVEGVPSPKPAAGQVRIAIRAAGVNFADTLVIEGKYQEKPPFPFTPGAEFSGDIVELGAGVQGLRVGDRVMGTSSIGAFAEELVAPVDAIMTIPDRMGYAEAAGFPIVYGTSHGALDWKARLQKGEWLLVHGAAGGVGLTAVEIGKAMGATVVATASAPEKLEVARAHGADHVIDYTKENFRDRVKDLTGGRGVDVVYDPVGGDVFDQSLRCIAWGGRLVVIGFAAGKIQQVPANLLLVKNCDALGFYWGSYRKFNPELVRRSFEQLARWFEEGKLKPHVSHTLGLEEVARAFELLRTRKATGKVVLTAER
jgi:NADPH:quinone reductase